MPRKGYAWAWASLPAGHEPSDVIVGLGEPEFDAEGRYVELRFGHPAHKRRIISLDFPSGSSSEDRQQAKVPLLDLIYPHLAA